MTLTLHHHPFTRAAGVLWMLEEVGCEYTLEHLDIMTGAQKRPEFKGVNPMGKIPTLVDGDTVVTEAAAIGLYLADRYALGRLAPPPPGPGFCFITRSSKRLSHAGLALSLCYRDPRGAPPRSL